MCSNGERILVPEKRVNSRNTALQGFPQTCRIGLARMGFCEYSEEDVISMWGDRRLLLPVAIECFS